MIRWILIITMFISEHASAVGGAIAGAIRAREKCVEHHSTWSPQWSGNVGLYAKLNSATGAVANNASVPVEVGSAGTAKNANGTGLSFVQARIDQGLTFDGTDDYIQLGTHTTESTVYTIAMWVKPSSSTANPQNYLVRGDSVDCYYNPAIGRDGGAGTIFVAESGCSNSGLIGSYAAAANTWVHVAVTRNGSTVKVYINGALQTTDTSQTAPGGTTGGRVTLGAGWRRSGPASYLNYASGVIDDVLIMTVALSDTEVANIYNAQSACP